MESTTTETNFVSSNNNPADDHGDGSNVTGIIAATRNNGVGIAGVLSNFRVVVCKILNASNGGTTSSLIAATNYARRLGVSVMNLSLQNYPFSSTLANEFTACQNAGILLSICAGNQGRNNDTTPNYPSSCPHPNIIAIANHDDTDVRWAGSFKTLRTTARQAWVCSHPARAFSRPSPAIRTATTPHVTGGAVRHRASRSAQVAQPGVASARAASFHSWFGGDAPSYSGLCTSGGRLNALGALPAAVRAGPAVDLRVPPS